MANISRNIQFPAIPTDIPPSLQNYLRELQRQLGDRLEGDQYISGNMEIGGTFLADGIHFNVTAVSSSTTLTLNDDIVVCSAEATLTLPAVSTAEGKIYLIISDTSDTITIDGNGAETVDGSATQTLTSQYTAYLVVCNGSEWFTV